MFSDTTICPHEWLNKAQKASARPSSPVLPRWKDWLEVTSTSHHGTCIGRFANGPSKRVEPAQSRDSKVTLASFLVVPGLRAFWAVLCFFVHMMQYSNCLPPTHKATESRDRIVEIGLSNYVVGR